MKFREHLHKIGELRPSQVMLSFGVGAVVDLPNISAIILGLDDWDRANLRDHVYEPRLLRFVRYALHRNIKYLYWPPTPGIEDQFSPEARTTGLPVRPFPSWLRCSSCGRMATYGDGVVEFRPNWRHIDRTRFVHRSCKKSSPNFTPTMIPVRRLIACEGGHIDDFPWLHFVHRGATGCKGPLYWEESGVAGTAGEVWIRCETCEVKRPLSDAFRPDPAGKTLPLHCSGNHPHLDRHDACEKEPKPVVLGASNNWFPLTVSVISLPTRGSPLDQIVERSWPNMQGIKTLETVTIFRKGGMFLDTADYSDEQLFDAIERRRASETAEMDPRDVRDLLSPEWQAFTRLPDSTYRNPNLHYVDTELPEDLAETFATLRRVERLREARALIGFTRLVAPGDFGQWDFEDQMLLEQKGPLSRTELDWAPAIEMRGEGLFLQLREDRVAEWLRRPEVVQAERILRDAHIEHRRRKDRTPPEAEFPGMRYVLLHTLSHALMRQFALECGYGQASMRERIYSRNADESSGPMAGILIYTAAPDSEGTLGGLVSLGEPVRFGALFSHMLEDLEFCSSDPHCAEHTPSVDDATLNGAACHICLYSPETSCERGNSYLDRSTIAKTMRAPALSFFD